ncbi:aminotransferase class I/II-fold pyridoxal phosphate-dependent enzyme, partial [Streptomyces sp. NPDC005069]
CRATRRRTSPGSNCTAAGPSRSSPSCCRAGRAGAVATALYEQLTAAGLTTVRPDAAVVSVRAPSADAAVRWAADCRTAGIAVGCFRPPSVPDGISRLRLTARADLTEAQIANAVETVLRTAPAA